MKIDAFAATAIALALCAPALARADTATTPEVVVTAGLEETLPEDLALSGVRVDTVTDQQIRNGGYVDIAQSLQALSPGLFLLPKNGPFDYADISLLGSRTDDVLWLVDGVRINNRLYSGTPPLDTFPSAMVEKVEVLEGGQALFYGTAAVAGAVNIVTRGFSKTRDGQVTFAGDSNSGIRGAGQGWGCCRDDWVKPSEGAGALLGRHGKAGGNTPNPALPPLRGKGSGQR